MDWFNASKYPHNEEWIIDNADKVDWNVISARQQLTIKIINMFLDKINWNLFSENPFMNINIIRLYTDKIVWDKLREEFYDNINFIREFKDYINWSNFIEHFNIIEHKLNEDILEEFKDNFTKRDWRNLSSKFLSHKFMIKYLDKLDLEFIYKAGLASEEIETLIKQILPSSTIHRLDLEAEEWDW